jgi:multiple RNA-binding domain-containing protein 1
MSSRIIVKHLPSKSTEKRLRELFSSCGEVTDVKLMKTKGGTFRHFGFVGFVEESQAAAAVEQLNKTYIDASKIEVELAKPYGHEELARPWSKYSKGSSAYSRREKANMKDDKETKEREKVDKGEHLSKQNHTHLAQMLEEYGQLESDPSFQEFLDVHQHKSKVKSWSDNMAGTGAEAKEKGATKKRKKRSSDVNSEGEEVEGEVGDHGDSVRREEDGVGTKEEDESITDTDVVMSAATSDMDYLRSKMVKVRTNDTVASSDEDSTDHEDDSESEDQRDVSSKSAHKTKQGAEEGRSLAQTPYTVKMLGLPFTVKQKNIEEFFHPLKVVSARFTTDNQGRPSGRAYMDFESEKDLKEALKRHRDCIGHRYIELFRDDGANVPGGKQRSKRGKGEGEKPWERSSKEAEPESIAESGRLFIRNLSFLTTEEQLAELFGKFGPLTESTIPLDKTTGKPTGLGFITYMLPEHAVKAYEALDGQIFQGRLMHILPAKARHTGWGEGGEDKDKAGSSYKKTKEKKNKEEAGKGHNWNTLFLGANAVADAIADRYAADKSEIFNPEGGDTTAAVRMALGETQLVAETREFMEAHGVNLEVFEKAQLKRSKNVVLVKNLPFGTTEAELHQLFQPFGPIGRLILPPGGISALVEFTEALNARAAFKKLVYTSFKHLPLYLEWAPIGALKERQQKQPSEKAVESKEETVASSDPGEQCTVFVKNLNFSTTEDALSDLFSKIGRIKSASIARKRTMKDPSKPLSMGFGFVEFERQRNAQKAIKRLQNSELDGHKLELKLSHRESHSFDGESDGRRKTKLLEQKSAKILVRNIPFEASKREVKELFQTFGELKTVRLPKKFSSSQGEHRGFGFVEFTTKDSARRAFDSLKHSTHLYGRRLVLEWAEEGESVETIRKRTAEHFSNVSTPQLKRRKDQQLLNVLEQSNL